MNKRSLFSAVAAAALLIGGVVTLTFWLLDQSVPGETEPAGEPRTEPVSAEPTTDLVEPAEESGEVDTAGRIRITLYLLSRTGHTLVAEEREIPLAEDVQEQAKQVVRELLRGSRRGLASPLPSGVQLREVFITPQGLAYVDLSQELVSNHIGGTCAEELTIYSLSKTLIANFPAVKRVQFLVEGREVKTLAGHLDLTRSYGRGPRRLEQDSTTGP